MKAYELLFFIDPAIDDESRLATMKRIENAIAAGEGTIDYVDNWGKRKLAFEMGAGLVIVPLMDFQSGETPCDKISRYLKQL